MIAFDNKVTSNAYVLAISWWLLSISLQMVVLTSHRSLILLKKI